MTDSKARRRTRTIGDAKAHFAECIREAEAGQSIVLTRHGRPVARLGPVRPSSPAGVEREEADQVAERTSPYSTEPSAASLSTDARRAALRTLLVKQVWPRVPKKLLGRGVTKQEREEILGYTASTGASSEEPRRGRR